MLCGIYAPDAGTAYILGNDIITQMNKIQTSLGINIYFSIVVFQSYNRILSIQNRKGFCPQYDILYDDLTVAEHIDLVASVRFIRDFQLLYAFFLN